MKKPSPKFEVGDLVYARVRGYPPWPARIMEDKKSSYAVMFYGTYETANIKANDLFLYNDENKAKWATKRKGFKEALEEMEMNPDIVYEVKDAPAEPEVVEEAQAETDTLNTKLEAESAEEVATPAPKKGRKRKAEQTPASAPPTKQAREKETPATETKTSRSGRKVKAKAMDDYDVDDEEVESPVKPTPTRTPKSTNSGQKKMWVKIKSTGQLIELNLDKDRPAKFENRKSEIMWDRECALKFLRMADSIQSGRSIPDELRQELEKKTTLTAEEKAILDASSRNNVRQEKLAFLRNEQSLVDYEHDIIKYLPLKDPEMSSAYDLLKDMDRLNLTPLMIKKRPHVVDTLRRLRKYVGPKTPSSDPRENKEWKYLSEKIRSAADIVLDRIRNMFDFDDDKKFFEAFPKIVEEFKAKTSGMETRQYNLITSDPTA